MCVRGEEVLLRQLEDLGDRANAIVSVNVCVCCQHTPLLMDPFANLHVGVFACMEAIFGNCSCDMSNGWTGLLKKQARTSTCEFYI